MNEFDRFLDKWFWHLWSAWAAFWCLVGGWLIMYVVIESYPDSVTGFVVDKDPYFHIITVKLSDDELVDCRISSSYWRRIRVGDKVSPSSGRFIQKLRCLP